MRIAAVENYGRREPGSANALTGLFVFLGKWLFDAIYLVAGRGSRGTDLLVQLVLWSPIAAAITALIAVLLLTLFRPLYRSQSA